MKKKLNLVIKKILVWLRECDKFELISIYIFPFQLCTCINDFVHLIYAILVGVYVCVCVCVTRQNKYASQCE